MLSLARMVEAFAFLGQICPDGVEEVGEWVRTRASSYKILNAVAIALKAEELIYKEHKGQALRVSPQLAVRILEVGSETHEGWLQNFWAGLLISSISAASDDRTGLDLVELFSQLTSIPIRIFTVVCTNSTKTLSETGDVTAKPLACNLEQLSSTVGARGPQVQRDLASLASVHLIEKSASASSALHASHEIWITPTLLALQLFALCNGHRGSLRDFYFVDSPEPAAAG
jgi:hypothetical protein